MLRESRTRKRSPLGMLRPKFGLKRFQAKEFEYFPRYHTPVQEDKELLEKDPDFRTKLESWHRTERSKHKAESTRRLVLIAAALFALIYVLLKL